jgi:hypothetical protein
MMALLGFAGLFERAMSSWPIGAVQDRTVAYLDRSETRAVEAFAAARTINAGISLLKSADLSAVVVQVAPLEVLEPIDDLAKQFSDVMAVSIVAILVERLILQVSQAWALGFVLPTGCALLAAAIAIARWPALGLRLAALGRSLVLLAIFARFVVLAAGWVGDGVTERFLARDLDTAIATLNASGGKFDQMTAKAVPSRAATPSSTPSFLDQAESAVSSTISSIPDRTALAALVTGLPEQFVRAIEIFLVQTIFTPFLVALFLYGALRGVVRPARLGRP